MGFDFATWHKEIKDKIDQNVKLNEQELSDLIDGEIDRVEGDDHRWQRAVKSIIKLNDELYAINWMQGLTENCDNSYNNQPHKVKKVIKTVEVVSYEKV